TLDDHEVQNNWAGEWDQYVTPPEIFLLRRQAAFQAYYENMPLKRSSMPRGPDMQLYRRTLYGDLLNANFMDTRQYRTDQPCGDDFKPYCAE
ncbi:alkaline phosphatase D family protein, partial [Acinetobacter baumannii]